MLSGPIGGILSYSSIRLLKQLFACTVTPHHFTRNNCHIIELESSRVELGIVDALPHRCFVPLMSRIDQMHLKASQAEGPGPTNSETETNEFSPRAGSASRLDKSKRDLGQEEASGQAWVRAEAGVYCMGTVFHIVAYGNHREHLETAVAKSLGEARRLDGILSNYCPESELSQVNRFGSRGPMAVSSELFHFLSICVAYSEATQGTFDITVGPLVKVAGFYKGTGRIPQPGEVLRVLDKVGYRNIILDEENMTVHLARADVELDPGGLGKGFAVDKMAESLKRDRVNSALISAGGSTIFALGTPPNEPGWKVTIKDPHKPSTSTAAVRLKNEGISTSGNYEKFSWADGKIWGHIMDPRTGCPAMGTLAVSVIAPHAVDSEAWAKPFFILGRAWTKQHKPQNFQVLYCEDKPHAPCDWL